MRYHCATPTMTLLHVTRSGRRAPLRLGDCGWATAASPGPYGKVTGPGEDSSGAIPASQAYPGLLACSRRPGGHGASLTGLDGLDRLTRPCFFLSMNKRGHGERLL